MPTAKRFATAAFRASLLATALAVGGTLAASSPARAGDDPSIQGETRRGVQAAMQRFSAEQAAGDGSVLHYDPVEGKLLRLKLESLHEGIVRKGHFYVSCADFRDTSGSLYDLDFLVVPDGEGYRVQQAIVHAVDGAKRDYHLEQRWPGLF